MQRIDCDVLVVGAGMAGLTTALSIVGRRVALLCSWMPPAGTASAMAQGGIAAAVGADDSAALHLEDTLRAGAGACDAEAARVLCGEAASAIAWLESQGVVFDQRDGVRAMHREAAHSRARVLHVDHDRTGFGLTRALVRALRARADIQVLSGQHAVRLLPGERGVAGVLALDRKGQPCVLEARDTVLATGGLGQLFARTTNPRNACGDGLAMALAAGARAASLEFVQFHPTALDVQADPAPLVTEAVRGAGAALIDARGARFMRDVHPAAELAPRDVIARAVWTRITAGERVYLDARELFAREPAAFPAVRALCAQHHLDPAREPLPVAPAAHYHMGGVAVDLQGRSSLAHLWACGEVACTGAHGANRLASNSLLEAVVFGRRVAGALTPDGDGAVRTAGLVAPPDGGLTLDVDRNAWRELRDMMWAHAGIVRNAAGLTSALAGLSKIEATVPPAQIVLLHRLRLARSLVEAALARKTSVGAHYRDDAATVV